MQSSMSGICIHPNANEINDFTSNDYNPLEWEPLKLQNGRIIGVEGQSFKKVIFDFDGGDFSWSGFVKGFIYPDGKYLAKVHYVPEAKAEPVSLNGSYTYIENGIELKGIWYSSEEAKYGFFMRLENPPIPTVAVIPVPLKPVKEKKKVQMRDDTFPRLLTNELLQKVTLKAQKIQSKADSRIYNHYQHIVSLKPQPNSLDDLVIAMSIAYSWMPTMLDIYLPRKKKEIEAILNSIRKLGAITNLDQFERKQEEIEVWLTTLTGVINHSIVGVSKTLHIFYPKTLPIIDSRVLKGWKLVFGTHFKKFPDLALPVNIPQTTPRMVRMYMSYWKTLLLWNYNTGNKDIRKLEEPFYWLGKE